MARFPGATWVGPTINEGDGDGRPGESEDRMSGSDGMVIHIAEGSFLGTEAWQLNPNANVSSHFIVAKDGRVAQMVDTADRSWCQVAGNSRWYSVENEGFHGESPTAQQVEALAGIYAWLIATHGVPARITDSVLVGGLGWHGMGGTAWGGHFDCPGEPFKAARPEILARAIEINGGEGGDMTSADDWWNLANKGPLPGQTETPDGYGTISNKYYPKIWEKTQQDAARTRAAVAALDAKLDRVLAALGGGVAGPGDITPDELAAIEAAAEKGAKEGIEGATIHTTG